MAIFDYDWWHGEFFQTQIDQAKLRCAKRKFPDVDPDQAPPDSDFAKFRDELDARIIICLRDGLHYEIAELVDVGSSSYLTAECVPGDDGSREIAPIIAVPFDEIARVEVVGIHPSERLSDGPHITGFRAAPEPLPPVHES